jgi:hypothetical protein
VSRAIIRAAALAAAVAAVSPCAAQTHTQPKPQSQAKPAAPTPPPADTQTQARTPTQEALGILAVACIDNVGDAGATRRWAGKAGVAGAESEIARMGHGVTDMWRLMTPAGAKILLLLTKDDTCQVLATNLDPREASGLVERGYHAKLLGVGSGPEPKRRFYKVEYRGATLSSMVVYSEAALRHDGMWDQVNGNGKK